MGIGLGFGVGPLRVYVPLNSRRRRRVWWHDGCAVDHRSPEAASAHAVKLWERRQRAGEVVAAKVAKRDAKNTTKNAAPAGWYPDPADPAWTRYWDGASWTSSRSWTAPQPR